MKCKAFCSQKSLLKNLRVWFAAVVSYTLRVKNDIHMMNQNLAELNVI